MPLTDRRGRAALVTGGAGFIGSHLADALLAAGTPVTILDDLSTGHRGNVPAGARLIEGSILDGPAVAEALTACDAVYHLAAVVSVPESVADPRRCHAVNATGTAALLEAARDAGVRRLVLASSCAVYGNEPRLPSRETDPIDPISPYAASKAAAEAFTSAFGRSYSLDTVSLRFFNVFGPRQDPRSAYAAVVAAFSHALATGRRPRVHGDGRQTRDFVAVANVVDACVRAGAMPDRLDGAVINVGAGRRTSLLELLQALGRLHGVEPGYDFGPARTGDVRDSCADLARARALLGYEPVVDLEAGLRRLLAGDGPRG